MSKLYEILKQIERRKEGPAFSKNSKNFSQRVSSTSRKKVVILIGILALSFGLGVGSFYLFKIFFFPETYVPQRSLSPPSASREVRKLRVQEPPREKTQTQVSKAQKSESPKPNAKIQGSKVRVDSPVQVKSASKAEGAGGAGPKLPEKVVVLTTSNGKQKKEVGRPSLKRPAEKAVAKKTSKIKKEPAGPPLPLSPEERLRGLLVRAESLRKEGRCKEAIELYKEYLSLRKVPEVLNNYAACLFLIGDLEQAEKAWRESLKLADDPIVRLNLVMAEIKKGNYAEACLEFKKIEPMSGSFYRSLAEFLKARCH